MEILHQSTDSERYVFIRALKSVLMDIKKKKTTVEVLLTPEVNLNCLMRFRNGNGDKSERQNRSLSHALTIVVVKALVKFNVVLFIYLLFRSL